MAISSLFPEQMLSPSFSLETIIAKMCYFQDGVHLLHWQSLKYSEHEALDHLYKFIFTFKDELIEKLMGYLGRRPSIYKQIEISKSSPMDIVCELCNYADELVQWAKINRFSDIENMAQELSGESAKTKYLLTLS